MVIPRLRNGSAVGRQSPFLKEDGERIGRKAAQRMVCRIENEFSAASDGTKLADGQGIAIALGVMVQHAVALKIPRVIHIVIVGGVFPHLNGRVFDNIFQVNGAVPLGTGIYLPIRYHVISSGMVSFYFLYSTPVTTMQRLTANHLYLFFVLLYSVISIRLPSGSRIQLS